MAYSNLFLDKTDEELEILYEQYLEWCDTAIIPDNELGKIRDMYCMAIPNALLVMELDLLREIAKRWSGRILNNNEIDCFNSYIEDAGIDIEFGNTDWNNIYHKIVGDRESEYAKEKMDRYFDLSIMGR